LRRREEGLTKKGDAVSVRCKVHGNRKLIIGTDISEEEGSQASCPYCRENPTGPLMCGMGWVSQQGVQYIVDEQGRIRHFENLSEVEAERIREGKKKVIEVFETRERNRREKYEV